MIDYEPVAMTNGTLVVQTVVRIYCAGPNHNHLRLVVDGYGTEHDVEFAVRMHGWRQTLDGRWWCSKHLPKGRGST